MDKLEVLNQLTVLLNDLEAQSQEKNVAEKAEQKKKSINTSFKSRLDVFDDEHKAVYIREIVGEKPIKPAGLIKLIVPVYLVKKSNYGRAIIEYGKQYKLAEKAYYFDFQNERLELQKTAEKEKADAIAALEDEYQLADQAYRAATERVNSNTIVSDRYKTVEIVSELIDYLQNGRSDTLKEALNLWHDEEHKRIEAKKAEAHRAEMLKLEQERLKAAQEALELQQMALLEAEEAADSAKEAARELEKAAEDLRNN